MRDFSDFIRNASPEEKERVYLDVLEKATKRQMREINKSSLDCAQFGTGIYKVDKDGNYTHIPLSEVKNATA